MGELWLVVVAGATLAPSLLAGRPLRSARENPLTFACFRRAAGAER